MTEKFLACRKKDVDAVNINFFSQKLSTFFEAYLKPNKVSATGDSPKDSALVTEH